MPELAEVRFYANQWAPGIGEEISSVRIHAQDRVFRETDSKLLKRELKKRVFRAIHTHGKRMLFQFGEDGWLEVHLGMSGKLFVAEPGAPIEKHDHLVLKQTSRLLHFQDYRKFGLVRWLRSEGIPLFWMELPPEVQTSAFTKKRLKAFLGRRKKSPLKAILLDQAMFPGIGNWMADEILWRSHLHPGMKAIDLNDEESDRLWKVTREVARQAIKLIAKDWGQPPDSWLFNHRWKKGGICPCGEPLARGQVGGRTSAWCPSCQRV